MVVSVPRQKACLWWLRRTDYLTGTPRGFEQTGCCFSCWVGGNKNVKLSSCRHGDCFEGKTLKTRGVLGHAPLRKFYPQKIKIYAIWRYPEVVFVEVKITVALRSHMLMHSFFTSSQTFWHVPLNWSSSFSVKWPPSSQFVEDDVTVRGCPAHKHSGLSVPPACHVSN